MKWSDSRIAYPYDNIQITPRLYVVETKKCTDNELWSLLYYPKRIKMRDPYDMMSYLLWFEPRAYELTEISSDRMIYTPAFENFVMSAYSDRMFMTIDKYVAEKISQEMYNYIKQTKQNCKDTLKQLTLNSLL